MLGWAGADFGPSTGLLRVANSTSGKFLDNHFSMSFGVVASKIFCEDVLG